MMISSDAGQIGTCPGQSQNVPPPNRSAGPGQNGTHPYRGVPCCPAADARPKLGYTVKYTDPREYSPPQRVALATPHRRIAVTRGTTWVLPRGRRVGGLPDPEASLSETKNKIGFLR